MQRAVKIFLFDEREADAPFVQRVWRTRSEPYEAFTSVAASHWEIVVTRQEGQTHLTLRGPETKATVALIPEDAEFFGIEFRLGAFMPHFPTGPLVDGSLTLPAATGTSFWLDGSAWDFPDYDNADVFVERLVRRGLLVRDALVEAALRGHVNDLSARLVQRRVLHATGLTQGAIRQIERARQAAELLDNGATILDAVALAGYADQPHLGRSLKRFMGHTPAQIARDEC
jgi:AraC-like DNA-binding protein